MHHIERYSIILMMFIVLLAPNQCFAKRFDFNRNKIGGNFRLILYAQDSCNAVRVSDLAYTLIDSLDQILSNYKNGSEVSRLNAHKTLASPSRYFLEVLQLSLVAYTSTNGYFDISIRPVMLAWDEAEEKGALPRKRHLKRLEKCIGLDNVLCLSPEHSLRLEHNGSLDVGGLAKGYIIDEVYKLLLENDVPAFLIEAAGDIRVFGKPEDREYWTVGVSSNHQAVVLVALQSGQAIATSGRTYRYRIIEEEKYSHVINPKTLTPIRHNLTTSVVASTATEADYLASALNIVLDKEEQAAILNKHNQAGLLLLDGRKIIFQSELFPLKTQTK